MISSNIRKKIDDEIEKLVTMIDFLKQSNIVLSDLIMNTISNSKSIDEYLKFK